MNKTVYENIGIGLLLCAMFIYGQYGLLKVRSENTELKNMAGLNDEERLYIEALRVGGKKGAGSEVKPTAITSNDYNEGSYSKVLQFKLEVDSTVNSPVKVIFLEELAGVLSDGELSNGEYVEIKELYLKAKEMHAKEMLINNTNTSRML